MLDTIIFDNRTSVEQVEESTSLAPKFDADGLIPVVTTDFDSGEVLMHAYMNREALSHTIQLGEAVYYSRSRQTLWHKGQTSGLVQIVKEIRIDDDQDCIWLQVDVQGGAIVSKEMVDGIDQTLCADIVHTTDDQTAPSCLPEPVGKIIDHFVADLRGSR